MEGKARVFPASADAATKRKEFDPAVGMFPGMGEMRRVYARKRALKAEAANAAPARKPVTG